VLEEFCPRLAGLQVSEETPIEATRLTLAVLETPFRVALRVAVWLALMAPAVALNVVEVEPAATVAEAATGSMVLLLDRDTTVPPLGAAETSATVQVELAPEVRLVGEHCKEDKPGCQFRTATAPEVAEMLSADPFAKAAIGLLTAMGTVEPLVAGERVTVTVPTTPLPIVESVAPIATHVTVPLTELQVRVLPAVPRVAPAATTTELTSLGANERAHCKPAGAPPLPFNERLSATEPPSTAEPDDRLSEVGAGAEVVKVTLAVAEVPLYVAVTVAV